MKPDQTLDGGTCSPNLGMAYPSSDNKLSLTHADHNLWSDASVSWGAGALNSGVQIGFSYSGHMPSNKSKLQSKN